MNNPPPDELSRDTYGLTPPSEAHHEAIGSVVYRLSELMFGSLLASYVLGFIGFSVPAVATALNNGNLAVLYPEALTYLFISMSFAYLTAGLYISYHAGILTMPHLPFSNLRWDYLIALLHSVLFGISMLLPLWLPVCIGCVLLAALARQRREYNDLVYTMSDILTGNSQEHRSRDTLAKALRKRGWKDKARQEKKDLLKEQKIHLKEFRKLFAEHLENAYILKSWWTVSRKTSIGAISLILAGLAAVFGKRYLATHEYLNDMVLLFTLLCFLSVMWVVSRVLKDRADFMYSDDEKKATDQQFSDLIKKLAKGK